MYSMGPAGTSTGGPLTIMDCEVTNGFAVAGYAATVRGTGALQWLGVSDLDMLDNAFCEGFIRRSWEWGSVAIGVLVVTAALRNGSGGGKEIRTLPVLGTFESKVVVLDGYPALGIETDPCLEATGVANPERTPLCAFVRWADLVEWTGLVAVDAVGATGERLCRSVMEEKVEYSGRVSESAFRSGREAPSRSASNFL